MKKDFAVSGAARLCIFSELLLKTAAICDMIKRTAEETTARKAETKGANEMQSNEKKTPTMLMILDGYGLNPDAYGNAVAAAKTPNLDRVFAECPKSSLQAAGRAVGLPDGVMGNSEVGHLNLGAGRIVYQELSRINKEIEEGGFFENEALGAAMDRAAGSGGCLHLWGLLSDGGVHSHNTHLYALLEMAAKRGVSRLAVHAFLDGRDVPPRCALKYIDELEEKLQALGLGRIASVSGRYYAMDRDKRWERLEKAYLALSEGKGLAATSARAAVEEAYARGENDEFVLPTVVGEPCCVEEGDSVIFFDFRPDRAREITRAFVDPAFDGFARQKTYRDLSYVCFTQYDASMPNVSVAFPPQSLKNTMAEWLAKRGLRQLHIAETEKYAHVTFFFNGGLEAPYEGEDRILIPSPSVATYDLQPSMSAPAVADAVIEKIREGIYDLIVLNFANADMVGHTGVFSAAVEAVETVDACVGRVLAAMEEAGGQVLLTADHGNAEQMLDESGGAQTAHSLNPVPLAYIGPQKGTLEEGILADVSPTLLRLMGLPIPPEMSGRPLFVPEKKTCITQPGVI